MLEFMRFGRGEAHHTCGKTRRRRGDAAAGSNGEPPHLVVKVKRIVHLDVHLDEVCSWSVV